MSQPAGQRGGARARTRDGGSAAAVTTSTDLAATGEQPVVAEGRRGRSGRRRPRRARVYVTRIDPWSVTKAAFLLALAIGIVIVVAVGVVFWTLDSTGALDALSRTVDDVLGTGGFDLLNSLEMSRVLGLAAVIASVEIVLVSALATIFAFLYNLTVGLTGGVEVVLSDE